MWNRLNPEAVRAYFVAVFNSSPKRFVSANADRALFLGFFAPLFGFAVYVGYNDLSVLIELQSRLWVHDYSDMGSSGILISNLVQQAENLNPFRLYGVGGGPLRHLIFFPFFAILQPGMKMATELTNVTTAVFDFVVIPGLVVLLVYRSLGRIPALVSVFGVFTLRRGLLYLLSPLGLTENYLRGPEFYYIGNWQYVYGLVLLLLTVVLLDTHIRSADENPSLKMPILVGLFLGWTGGSVYVYGLVGAAVVTLVLLARKRYRDWLTIGGTAALFVPVILSYDNAVANITGERWTQAGGTEIFGLRINKQLAFGPHFEPSIFIPLLGITAILLVSRRFVTESKVLETLVLVSALVVGFEAHYFDHLSTYVVVETMIPLGIGALTVFFCTYFPSETYQKYNTLHLSPRRSGGIGAALGSALAGLMLLVFP